MAEIIKISELPEATSLENLYTPGTDNTNRTVKVPIEMMKGNKGERGDTPTIGGNGNWWLGDVDTGSPAYGTDGALRVNLYGQQFEETIPGTKSAPLTTIKGFIPCSYVNQASIRGKNIYAIEYSSNIAGLITLWMGKARNGTANSWEKQYPVVSGRNKLIIDRVLAADEILGIIKENDTAIPLFNNVVNNPVGGSLYFGDGIYTGDLCMSVYTGTKDSSIPDGDLTKLDDRIDGIEDGLEFDEKDYFEAIPYQKGGSYTSSIGVIVYDNQTAIQGKTIRFVKVSCEGIGRMSVEIKDSVNGSPTWSKGYDVKAGVNYLWVDRDLGASQYLGVRSFTNGGRLLYMREGGGNPVGGSLYWNGTKYANQDACYGVFINRDSSNPITETYRLLAIGDSITYGYGGYIPYIRLVCDMNGYSYTNYGVSGATTNDLMSQINKIPEGFKGIVTCMIGTNDFNRNVALGDVNAILAKSAGDLALGNSFAENFRYCIHALFSKAPGCIFINISPINPKQGWSGLYPLQSYRDIQDTICAYYSVANPPIYKDCGISVFSGSRYLSDNVHPNENGHVAIAKALAPYVKKEIGKRIM